MSGITVRRRRAGHRDNSFSVALRGHPRQPPCRGRQLLGFSPGSDALLADDPETAVRPENDQQHIRRPLEQTHAHPPPYDRHRRLPRPHPGGSPAVRPRVRRVRTRAGALHHDRPGHRSPGGRDRGPPGPGRHRGPRTGGRQGELARCRRGARPEDRGARAGERAVPGRFDDEGRDRGARTAARRRGPDLPGRHGAAVPARAAHRGLRAHHRAAAAELHQRPSARGVLRRHAPPRCTRTASRR